MYDDKAKIRDELIMTLTAELPVMRARLGMSQGDGFCHRGIKTNL